MTANYPKVSIAIVTYNRVDYLKESLASALALMPQACEVLVVNDGSKDATRDYLHAVQEPKLRVIHHESNSGRPAARNTAAANFKGDYLLWLDDDDQLMQNIIALHSETLERNPSAKIFYGDLVRCDQHLRPQDQLSYRQVPQRLVLQHLLFEDIFPQPGTMIHRSVFETVGLYDSSKPRCQDYDFWARAAIKGFGFAHTAHPVCMYRCHTENSANPEHIRYQSKYQCEIIERILRESQLEAIFPDFDWKASSKQSAALAMLTVAKIFFDHGDDSRALECANYAEDFASQPVVSAIKGMIYRSMRNSEAASEHLAKAVAALMPELANMIVPLGVPRGSEGVYAKACGLDQHRPEPDKTHQ